MIQNRLLLWKCHSKLISMCNKTKEIISVGIFSAVCVCVCAPRTTHITRWKIYIEWIRVGIKNHFGKFFRNHWAVRLPYTFVGGVETQNLYFYTNVCTVSEFESVSHFSSISHSLCFSLWLLFYEDVWVFAGRHRVLSKYLFIPCFVALQKYDYKNATKQMCMT